MGKFKIMYVVTAMLLVNQVGYTQDTVNELDQYLVLAAQNNPAVRAYFYEYLAALERVSQVGALPDPQATFSFFIKPMEQIGGNQVGNVQIMQMFPWFGTLRSAKDEASMMAMVKYNVFNASKSELFYEVKSTWYRLMKADREIELVHENIGLLESLEKLALVRFESPPATGTSVDMASSVNSGQTAGNSNVSGDGMGNMGNRGIANTAPSGSGGSSAMPAGMNDPQTGLQDVLRIRMEILELENKLAFLTDQRQTEQVRFNTLLNRDIQTEVLVSGSLQVQPLALDIMAISDSILSNNPMLAMLGNEAGAYSFMEEKARKMGWPMVGLGLDYMIFQEREGNTAGMNGKDMIAPMVSVSIPIYRKKYIAMQNEARLMQKASTEKTVDLKNNLLLQYMQFKQALDDADRRISLYKEEEELAARTTEIILADFSTSGADFEEVLRMQQKVLHYGFNHIEAVVDYNTSVALAEKLMNSVKY